MISSNNGSKQLHHSHDNQIRPTASSSMPLGSRGSGMQEQFAHQHETWHDGRPPQHPSGGAPYHHHPYHQSSAPPPGYHHRESQAMMQHHGHPIMHNAHPDANYSPQMEQQQQHHSVQHSPHPGEHNFYHQPPPTSPGTFYGHRQGPRPSHPLSHPADTYYPYGGHHPQYQQRPPDGMDYRRGGEPHQHPGYAMHYGHQHPGDPRLQQEQPHGYQDHPGYMYGPGHPAGQSLYMQDPHRQPFHPATSYTMGHLQAGQHNTNRDRPHSFPSHIGLPSISDDRSKTPSPAGIPPPPGVQEPHEISAPNSLDETDSLGGPLRHSGVVNRSGEHQYALNGSLPPGLGSSEKKQAIDTASVLLAFSSTKKRPPSTTSTLDDTDALSLATMSTLPHSVAPPDHNHSVCFPPPTDYPKRLAMPEDKERLNQLHCYIRSELLELVVIQPADGAKDRDSFGKIQMSTDPQQIGRVGLRCVHCSHSSDGGRTGPSMAIFYPKSTGEIYRLVTSWKRCHLRKCKNIPKTVRNDLARLNEVKARGKTSYWSESAGELGLINMPTKIGGICFSPTAENVSRSDDSVTPVKMQGNTTSETIQTTGTADTSPESLPTISDTSTLVSAMAKKALEKRDREEDNKSLRNSTSMES